MPCPGLLNVNTGSLLVNIGQPTYLGTATCIVVGCLMVCVLALLVTGTGWLPSSWHLPVLGFVGLTLSVIEAALVSLVTFWLTGWVVGLLLHWDLWSGILLLVEMFWGIDLLTKSVVGACSGGWGWAGFVWLTLSLIEASLGTGVWLVTVWLTWWVSELFLRWDLGREYSCLS